MGHPYMNNDRNRFNWKQVGSMANTDGFLIKAGSSYATAISVGAVAGHFINLYLKSTVTSGTVRGIYNRLYLAGAGTTTGESLRSFTTVYDVAVATAHGAHISLNFNATGSITGLGVGVRATLHVPNQVQSLGTYAAGQSEIYFDGTSARIAGAAKASIHRFICDGISGYTNDTLNVFEFVGMNATQLQTNTAGAAQKILRVDIDGTLYGVMLVAL